MAKLIVGCGYVGIRLAKSWRDAGEVVFVTTRRESRARDLRSQGFEPVVYDVTQTSETQLPDVTTIVFAVGFDRTSKQSIHTVYVDGLRRTLAHCPDSLRRFIYISSTGVYGQTDGNWVDESSPCEPNRDGGKACLHAEALLQSAIGSQAVVLRLAGIYGPDRLPQADVLQRGEPLQVAADAYLNLIHVDDAVQIIAACDEHPSPPNKLCVSDGEPVMRGDFYRYLAELLGTAPPEFEAPPNGSARAERSRGSKRISNAKLVASLAPDFRYPSYRQGLAAIIGNIS